MSDKTVVVTHPISAAGVVPLSHLIEILREASENVSLITGNEGWKAYQDAKDIEVQGILTTRSDRPHKRAMAFIRTQLWTSFALVRAAAGAKNVIFFSGGDYLIAPLLTSKILRKRSIHVLVGSSFRMMSASNDPFSRAIGLLSNVIYSLSNKILVYSTGTISDLKLERFSKKITICHEHFVRPPRVEDWKDITERDEVIGYVGRLAPEKGIMNLMEAVPLLLKKEPTLKVLICGDGDLRDRVIEFSDKNLPSGTMIMSGWVHHDELPKYISTMRLVVVPSYTEGLPNVILEAMSCGTPVLATPVGSIPEIIVDGNNGFIMSDNNPATIANEITRALEDPDLSRVSETARQFVGQEFGFEKTLSLWRQVLFS